MLDLMIVDDEKMVINDLVKLVDWRKNGYNIVSIATNGKMAMEKFSRHRPDVIITDVVMPVMKGLELLTRIKSISPETVVILISSFTEFSYAREALDQGAFSYMLKDEINEDTLTTMLFKVRSHLAASSTHRNPFAELARTGTSLAADFTFPDTTGYRSAPRSFTYMLCDLDLPPQLLEISRQMQSGEHSFMSSEIQFLKQASFGQQSVHSLYMLSGSRAMLEISSEKPAHTTHLQDSTAFFARNLGREFKSRFRRPVSVFLIPGAHDSTSVKPIYQQYEARINNRFFLGSELVIDLTDPCLASQGVLSPVDVTRLTALLRDGSRGQLLEGFGQLLQDAAAIQDFPGFQTALQTLMQVTGHYRREIGQIDWQPRVDEQVVDKTLDFARCRQWLLDEISSLVEERAQAAGFSRPVRKAVRFIRENYSDVDLSLLTVADHVGLSQTHLGFLFKKETGSTINTFITRVRVANAMTSLRTTDDKIYQIAEAVGYRSSQYFSQVFLKNVGCMPKEYRVQHGYT